MDVRAPLITAIPLPGPSLRMLAALQPQRYPILFDSAARGPLGRFTLLCAAPTVALWRDSEGSIGASGMEVGAGGFLDNLDRWWKSESSPADAQPSAGLPFCGGWIVYAGYELAAEIERSLRLPRARAPYSAFALRVTQLLVHDLESGELFAVSQDGSVARHAQLIADLESAAAHNQHTDSKPVAVRTFEEEDPEKFLVRVRAAKEHIAAGDIYQANLSRPWRLELRDSETPARVYAALRRANPAPFAASVSWQGMTLLSSSPERLLRIDGRNISTRPIAGTRARAGSHEQDQLDTAELVAHPKERAEHIMLIDLERNDLGRVCEAGSVQVDEYMATESYTHVHHIVSNVQGRLRANCSPIDALRALFPGGTITGCPKVRCMQIIAELEGEGRGAYTGSLGWLGNDGAADFNILIRTLIMDGREIELRAGAGIVADSMPERELEETRAKARGLLAAFGIGK